MAETAPISCIITSYNNRETLPRTVRSVLAQSQPVAEIIITDDCSTDGSQQLIADLCDRYAILVPILRERNLGVAGNRDLAIRAATQPFVTHIDGDDLYAPSKIAGEWRELNGATDTVAYSDIAVVDLRSAWRSCILDPRLTASGSAGEVLREFAFRTGPIPRDMTLSKDLYLRAGGQTHGRALYEDWEFKMRLATIAQRWRHSGTVGTIYVSQPNSLSRARQEDHARCKLEVFETLEEGFRTVLGDRETEFLRRSIAGTGGGSKSGPGSQLSFATRLRRKIRANVRYLRHSRRIRSMLADKFDW